MNDIQKSTIQEIVTLHNEIAGHLRLSLEKAIRIGELLTEQKASLQYREFTPWIKGNLPFTERTAQNYMRVYRERNRLKNESVSYLGEAYKLLKAPKSEIEGPELMKAREHQKALGLCRVELEAFKILEQKTYDMVDGPSGSIQDKCKALGRLSNKALILQNKATELRIRAEREAGRLLTELEERLPGIDWIEIIGNEDYFCKLTEMFSQRINN